MTGKEYRNPIANKMISRDKLDREYNKGTDVLSTQGISEKLYHPRMALKFQKRLL